MMPKTTTHIGIDSQLDDFVNHLIESGLYDSTIDVTSSALCLLEQQEKQTIALKEAIAAGDQSGESKLSLHDIAAEVKRTQQI